MKLFKNSTKFSAVVLLLLTVNLARGQQEPLFTQYNFNTQIINPAYSGSWENSGFLLAGRTQWLGMEGAPQTYAFSFQTSDIGEKVGLGINLVADIIGREKRWSVFGDYSYGVQIENESTLRLGLKFGLTSYENNFSQYVQYPGEPDPSIQYDKNIRYMPNFGVGAYWFSENYYFGLSVPKLLDNKFDETDNYSTQAELRHFYFIGGYVFELSEYLKFKPTLLAKATVGAPLNFDVTFNFLLNDKVWLGALYRTLDTYGVIAQLIVDNQLRIGYAADFSASKLQTFNYGTHEIMVTYELGFGERQTRWSSPRMF